MNGFTINSVCIAPGSENSGLYRFLDIMSWREYPLIRNMWLITMQEYY